MAHWAKRPIEYFVGSARDDAVRHLQQYRAGFTGYYFDRFSQDTDRFRITPEDILAVSMLSVDVPPRASIRILTTDAPAIEELLREIDPPDLSIWDSTAHLSEGSPAWRLWELIDDNTGVGATTTSKLLATKRPYLLPIYDSVVAGALFAGRQVVRNYWDLWMDEVRGPGGRELHEVVRDVQSVAGYDPHVSVLRIIDIVVWMTELRNDLPR